MTTRIPLERITDNPFQTRQIYTGIEELAESILKMQPARPDTAGLIQVPVGRIVLPQKKGWKILDPDEYGGVESTLADEPDAWVQIAAGHRRFRAFAYLSVSLTVEEIELDPGRDYLTFPVEILTLDDQKMADIAWEENNQRRDLTAIEEAEALDRAIKLFGWTQTEIGQRWSLSQSAVANKLRLLKLPDDAQQALRDGRLTERHGRALLTAMKSDTAYRQAAADIVPPPVDPDRVARAQALLKSHTFSGTYSQNDYWVHPEATCAVCRQAIRSLPYRNVHRPERQNGQQADGIYLCDGCHRAATGWEPPNSADADELVRHTLNRVSHPLDTQPFPTGDPIAGAADVVQPTCLGCPAAEMKGDDWRCFDERCYRIKAAAHRANLDAEAQARVATAYNGATIAIMDGYDGHDLYSKHIDQELLEQGVCIPGACARLRLRYTEHPQRHQIQPWADLPYVWNCNNSQSHAACVRRYTDSQQSEADQSEAAQAEAAKRERIAEAKTLLSDANRAIAQALLAGHEGAWRCLLDMEMSSASAAAPLAESVTAYVAKRLYWRNDDHFGKYMDASWQHDSHLERLRETITAKLNKFGIPRAASAEEIITKIEEMHGFLYTARLDETLTPEQLAGNCATAEDLLAQARHLRDTNQLTNGDARHLENNLIELGDELVECGEEIGQPIPKNFLISPEIV